MKLSAGIERYIEGHIDPQDDILAELERETSLNVINPRMLSGHLQGSVLTMFSKMIRPAAVLEIGTYTGYSAICLAKGLQPGGKLITIEMNDELEPLARKYFTRTDMSGIIDMRIGNALEIIPGLDGPFDLVFMDADKRQYSGYYNLVIDKVVSGGWIIADNILWDGKVAGTADPGDLQTKGILEFNAMVAADSRVEKTIVPVRDGIMVLRKR